MIVRSNTTLDDICHLVGFSATIRLIEWHGGGHVYVPDAATPDHPLSKLMGESALRALCEEFGGQMVWVPADVAGQHRAALNLKKHVAKRYLKGEGSDTIALALDISRRQVQRIRRELEAAGILPVILRGKNEGEGL
jgi:hypothetical protein